MKIFNNWHPTLIFLSVTEVTHEQRQGSALHCRNLACPLPGPDPAAPSPSTCHWELLMYKRHPCTDTQNLVLPFWAPTQGCAHTCACTHGVYGSACCCLAAILCILLPVSNPPFLCLISQITFAWLWPWWPAECKCLSAVKCLDRTGCQHATRIETETPLGFKARFAGVRAASADQQAK